jgi:GT2 family glycosyltransferase
MKATLFSLIIPSRHRTEQLRRLLDSLAASTEQLDDLEVIVVADSDDEETIAFRYDALKLKRVQVPPGSPMGALNAAGFREAAGSYLMLVNDDVIVRTRGWDRHVLKAFRSFPDGIVLVHVNDLFFKDTLCIFPFVSREFCLLAGGICPEDYIRYGIDNHIQDIFGLLSQLGHDRRIFLPDVVFEHTNIQRTAGGAARYVPDPEIHAVDIRLFESLEEKRSSIAQTALRHIENRQPKAGARVTIAVLSKDSKSPEARKCLELIRTCTPNHDLILLAELPGNCAPQVNRVFSLCATEYLVLMHDDVFVQPGWLDAMLRSMDPKIGAVTPVHKDGRGELSYAGIAISPDDSGFAPILNVPDKPRHIQTLSGAIALIDMAKCGHIRLDEELPRTKSEIDYGLRIWEQGFQVVCTPDTEVTHLGDGLPDPAEAAEHLHHWSARLDALRQGIWKTVPEISWIETQAREIDRLFEQNDPQEFLREGPALARRVQAYPALKDYIASLALSHIGNRPIRVDDQQIGHWAFLLGLSGRPVLVEAGVQGSNIILEGFTYYAVPDQDGARYTPTLRADTPAALKVLIMQHRGAPAHGHALRGSTPEPGAASLQELAARIDCAPSSRIAESPLHRPGELVREEQANSRRELIAELAGIVHRGAAGVESGKAVNPVLHFLSTGAYRGHKPNPLFDPAYYLAANPAVALSGINPLSHFLDTGALQGCRPNPLFDTTYYLRRYPDVAASGMNPLEHYLVAGTAKGYQPNPLFDTTYYLDQNPELATTGINPLAHFLESGARLGRKPHPLFDTTYYVRQNPNLGGMNPLAHFLEAGALGGCKPNPLFDTTYYVAQNPEILRSGMNPLQHFLEIGAAGGRRPNPLFDPTYYLEQNPGVAEAGLNPLVHFLEIGAKEERRPNPLFDTAYYLLQNPEVAAAGINPLMHFLEHTGGSGKELHRWAIAHQAYGVTNGSRAIRTAPLSVIIATRNHGQELSETLQACQRNRGECDLEFIVVDAGSSDDTRQRVSGLAGTIPKLRYYFLDTSNLARARNIGADLARNEVLLFLREDLRPANSDFFRVHASLHQRYADTNLAVLGAIAGLPHTSDDIAGKMFKLFGRGGAQFGDFDLTPHTFVSWPYFHAANVSVKKTFVRDWILDGFDADRTGSPYEDLELSCRIAKGSGGLRLYYNPLAVASRTEHASFAERMDHQVSLGKALAHLVQRHPELIMDCGQGSFLSTLRLRRDSVDEKLAGDFVLLLDGVKAWGEVLEGPSLEPWQLELQAATLEFCLLDGFASAWTALAEDARNVDSCGPAICDSHCQR